MNREFQISSELSSFINGLGQWYESMGVSRIAGQICGLLLVAEEPVSPEDISRILNVSRSSVSTNLKMLKMVGLLEYRRISGDRKEYILFSDFALENSLRIKIESYSPFEKMLDESIGFLKKGSKADRRMKDLKEYLKLEKDSCLDLMDRWKKISEAKAPAKHEKGKHK